MKELYIKTRQFVRARPPLTFALSRWRLCSANAGGVLKAVTSQIRDE